MAESLTLVIETDSGTAIRRVPDVSPLSDGETQGYAAEDAIRDAAATWGLPDFVFLPEQQRVGSGVRELGDGLLLVGDQAAVIQSKSRTDPTDNVERELSWLGKNVTKALKQGSGTVRLLKLASANMTNARGRTVPVDGKDYTWLTVVIVDHADPPRGFVPPPTPTEVPAIVLLRRDWEFLFDHLRSTRHVLAYLLRAARAGDVVELGDEPRHYHEYALADIAAEPDPVHPSVTALMGAKDASIISSSRAPLTPAGDDDRPAHVMLRMIMEDIANTPIPAEQEPDRLLMLAAIDGLAVERRTELGATLIRFMDSVARHTGPGTLIHSRTVIPNPGEFTPLVFLVASERSDLAKEALTIRTNLLHCDFGAAVGEWEHSTVSVMLTPSTVSGRLWDTSTSALWGDPEHSPELVEQMRALVAQAAVPPASAN
ncbi:hypothetical protein OHS58_03855 [Amycolatopsis sp. NBC_00348]|uniref:hypothetical protein n=1 Tax=Amycolatopsis sp. NBC_00348 TaxID=2975956 RepID=UPI002E273844